MSYSAGGFVLPHTLVRRERWLDGFVGTGVPLVVAGQKVLPDQPVVRCARLTSSPRFMQQAPSIKGPEVHVELVPAALRGRVVEVTPRGSVFIESHVARLTGALGVGRSVAGIITIWQPDRRSASAVIPPGAILIVPDRLDFALLRQAEASGVAAIIAGSISLRDLEGFMHLDLIEMFVRDDFERTLPYLPPLTLLLTEGPGSLPMSPKIVAFLRQYEGSIALLSGHTSFRRHIYPELLISLTADQMSRLDISHRTDLPSIADLLPGVAVRVCAGEYAGVTGVIDYLFVYEQQFPSGIRARTARIRLDNASSITVPLSLLEHLN